VYQGEASLALNMQKLILTCRYGQTYRDVLSPDADYYKSALHLSVSYPYYRFFYIALLAGTGNQDWWVTPSGFIIDDYNSESSYLANTISIPLNHKTDFTWYHKFMERDDTWQYAFGISLTGRY
jgi:hypothetical protein